MDLMDQYGPELVNQLRDQIGNLMTAAQVLTPAIQEQENKRYDKYLAIMNQSLYRLLRMIWHLEVVQDSKDLENLKEPLLNRCVLDLAGLCQKLSSEVTPLAEKAGVQFTVEVPVTLLMIGDEKLLRQMLLNLISNAIRAAGEGGMTGMRLTAESGRAAISVWDNGPATTLPEEQPSQKEPQEDSLLLENQSGLCLGVLVARQVAVLHGGTLVFERQENRGTRAVVSLDATLPGVLKPSFLHTPKMGYDPTGGFSSTLVELSDVLPFSAFLPEDVE